MFAREHHRRIARVLRALDAGLLQQHHCYFGGGTAIALKHGEYRESLDIDFLVSEREGYRELRRRLTTAEGLAPILSPQPDIAPARELRADQYGLRTLLAVDDSRIKFEIVLEARIAFEPPGPDDRIEGVATLTALDLAASKLLANSDRWSDDSVMSRDLIDLAMMGLPRPLLKQAIAKASAAYGDSIVNDLGKAIARLRDNPGRLDTCMRAMQITALSPAALWSRIRALQPRPRRTSA